MAGMYPRLVIWQFLFFTTLMFNVLLLYTLVAPWLINGCPPTSPTERAPKRNSLDPPSLHVVRVRADVTDVEQSRDREPIETLSEPPTEAVDHVRRNCSEEARGSVAEYLCLVEAASIFYSSSPNPVVVAKDVSRSRYFAQRDLEGWTLAFKNISYVVNEVSFRKAVTMANLTVFICLGIVSPDKHCLRPSSYYILRQGQRFNQIHGVRDSLWRKDGMCLMLREALGNFAGPRNFTFPCWVLPVDFSSFQMALKTDPRPYIVKPNSRGEGHGIFIMKTVKELEDRDLNGYVAQPLLTNPFLIEGKKFDFRTYVLVTSASPLRAYFYHEGLVRFASSRYNRSEASDGKESQVLTNTSIGKKYTNLANLTWTFHRLRHYLTTQGVDADQLFSNIQEAIVRTLLAAEYRFLRNFRVSLGGYDCHHCYQLLGVDVILDSHLKPYVIEVNGLPSMQLSNELGAPPDPTSAYTLTKFGLLHDILQIILNTSQSVYKELERDLQSLRVGIKPGPLCDPNYHVFCVDIKHLQKLIASKREFLNKGNFLRIYPTPDAQKYSKQILHLHKLIQRRFSLSGYPAPRTLWQTHYLYLALERLYSSMA